jgi:hypothetical protein
MGAVLRARDLTLHRDVALKLLPAGLSDDPERRARFAREARLLAALNHPNIAQVYGVEDSAAGPAIAMELVNGQTLRDLLRRGRLTVTDALSIAQQVATALDAAHERGIVHRDLKPANVMRTPEGVVKVLDFGLASSQAAGRDGDAGDTTQAVTAQGVILGTPAYMSPEQARGQAVDRRTDIWAFGCVLFELFSGQPAFAGATTTDTLAGVIQREPAWEALPASTPPAVRRLMQRCLDKDPRRRLRDIGDALPELTSGTSVTPDGLGAAAPVPRRRPWLIPGLAAATVVFGAMTTWLIVGDRSAEPAGTPIRFSVSPPPGMALGGAVPNIEASDLGVSPDGRTLAFIAAPRGTPPRIWIRPLADEAARALPGTEGAISLFWSPDGAAIGFFAGGQLKRVDAAGGAVVKICDVPVNVGLAGTWGADGVILFATVQGDRIARVSAAGGAPVAVIEPEQADPEDRIVWPMFLPDGRRFLYTRLRPGYRGQVMLADLSGRRAPLVDALSRALWIDPDWLLFVREGTLLAQHVDLDGGRAIGEPASVLGSVAFSTATGLANVAVSPTGVVLAQTRRPQPPRLVQPDRHGALGRRRDRRLPHAALVTGRREAAVRAAATGARDLRHLADGPGAVQ